MLKLELKKLLKKQIIIFTLIFSAIISLYMHIFSNFENIENLYPSYTIIDGTTYFNNKLSEILEFDEYSKIHRKVFIDFDKNYSMTRDKFFSFDKEKRKKVKEEMQKRDIEEYKRASEALKKYNIGNDGSDLAQNFEWGYFEHMYSEKEKVDTKPLMYPYISNNLARRLIYNSSLLYGIPFVVFLIIIFYATINSEREAGNLNFVKLNGVNLRKYIFSKLISMQLIIFLYGIFTILFSFIFALVFQIDLAGFREVYRVWDAEVRYYIGYELFINILLVYFMVMSILSVIIIFLNLKIKNKEKVLALLFIFFAMIYYLTEKFKILQNSFNIVYAMDYVKFLAGNVKQVVLENGEPSFEIFNGQNIYSIAIIFIFSMIVLNFSKFRNTDSNSIKTKKMVQSKYEKFNTILFELKKIFYNKSIFIVFIAMSIFVIFYYADLEINKIGNINNYTSGKSKEAYQRTLDYYYKAKKEIEDKYLAKGYSKEQLEDIGEVNMYDPDTERHEKIIKNHKNLVKGYLENNSELFYKSMQNLDDEYNKNSAPTPYIYISKYFETFNRYEYQLIMQESLNKNIKPVFQEGALLSKYQEFTTNMYKDEFIKRLKHFDTSPTFALRQFLEETNIDNIFMIILVFIILAGYTIDKENGKQIELIYTQPMNKYKYHIKRTFINFLVSYGFIIGILLIMFLISFAINGMGELNYPTIEYTKLANEAELKAKHLYEKTVNLMPIWRYSLRVIFVFGLQAYLISSFMMLVSIFSKTKMELILKTVFTIIIFIGISHFANIEILKLINPFNYMKAGEIANNSIMISQKVGMMSFYKSIAVLVIWSICFNAIGTMIFTKRRLLK